MKTLEQILNLELIADAPDHAVFYSQFDTILEYIKKGQIPARILRIWISSLDLKIHFSSAKRAEDNSKQPLRFNFELSELDSSIFAIAQNHHLTVASLDDYKFIKRVLIQFQNRPL